MIRVGIIGSTGYAGQELVRILLQHPDAEIVWYGSRSYVDKKYSSVFGNMVNLVGAKCMGENMDELAKQADVIFTATPQGLCGSLVNEEILSKMLLNMKNGMASNIRVHSLLKRLFMAYVKSTVRI